MSQVSFDPTRRLDPLPFELLVHAPESPSLRVLSFTGREEVNALYRYEILCTIQESDEQPIEHLLNASVSLMVHDGSGVPTRLHGIIANIEWGDADRPDVTQATLSVVPRLYLLDKAVTSRVFQQKSTIEIVDIILAAHGVAHEWRLDHTHLARDYSVQYAETSLSYISRILAEEGIFFYFVHPEPQGTTASSAELLILGDAADAYSPLPGDDHLSYRRAAGAGALSNREHHVGSFSGKATIEPMRAITRAYDFRRPSLTLTSEYSLPTPPGAHSPHAHAVYDHRLAYKEPLLIQERTARTALEQLRRSADTYHGQSWCRRLRPAHTFQLVDHPIERLNRNYSVTRVEHRGRLAVDGDPSRPVYDNTFECVLAETTTRPPPPQRVLRQVIETAVVVGPKDQELYTDALGRVKVQFHWDLDGAKNENSSCWVRVAQPWAGASWGFQFVPRIGMEVAVTFIGGDVDQPLITGAVSNSLNPPSHVLPSRMTRSGIRTRSTPGGEGFNELSFEDNAGAKQIYLHAQRNLDEVVLADHTSHIGANQTSLIGGNETTTVRGSQRVSVEAARVISVAGSLSQTVMMDRSDTTEGVHTESVTGNRVSRVGGNSNHTIEGEYQTEVFAGHSLRVEGDATVYVGTLEKPSSADHYASGDYAIGAGRVIRLRAERSILLEVGETSLELTPQGLRINGRTLDLHATDVASIRGAGPSILINEELELASRVVNLYGETSHLCLDKNVLLKGAQATIDGGGAGLGLAGSAALRGSTVAAASSAGATLLLDANANLDGALVKLNCGGGAEAVGSGSGDPHKLTGEPIKETKPLKIRLLDPRLKPYVDKRYVLVVAGERFEGRTDTEGALNADILNTAELGSLTLWVDDDPTKERQHWKIRIEDLPPPNLPNGARIRLTNLGYYLGPPVDDIDEDLQMAIEQFQLDHKLPPNGQLDAPTVAKLIERHGH